MFPPRIGRGHNAAGIGNNQEIPSRRSPDKAGTGVSVSTRLIYFPRSIIGLPYTGMADVPIQRRWVNEYF